MTSALKKSEDQLLETNALLEKLAAIKLHQALLVTSLIACGGNGDGLTDFDEVVTKAFDASINNFQFNPRVADIPEISVQLQSLLDISVNFTDRASTSQTMGLTNGTRNSTTLTTSDTYEQSIGEEVSGTIGSSASFPGFGISSSVTYSQNQLAYAGNGW